MTLYICALFNRVIGGGGGALFSQEERLILPMANNHFFYILFSGGVQKIHISYLTTPASTLRLAVETASSFIAPNTDIISHRLLRLANPMFRTPPRRMYRFFPLRLYVICCCDEVSSLFLTRRPFLQTTPDYI